MALPSQNIARSRIPPATQGSYFRYFTSRMCGALEFVCGALEPRCGALEPRCGALKPGALEPWGAQTVIHAYKTYLFQESHVCFMAIQVLEVFFPF